MTESGFYIISDQFFIEFPDPYLKGNKCEHRPHYYAMYDKSTDLYWMIPMSSRVDKYKKIIDKREQSGKKCDILHVAKLDNGKESAFLIQDIFPISEKYIKNKYTIRGNHLRVTSETLAKTIKRKCRVTLGMIRKGIKFTPTQPDVLKIEKYLLSEKSDVRLVK
ncbi:MAG: hypothetical protein HFE30_01880 [Clostridiales bacterium]|nr:hypothetical protein [Clostridiales bacterium]